MGRRGWKAVFKEKSGRCFSIVIGNPEERAEYIEGETTYRKEGFGPLTCFDTEEQARKLTWRLFEHDRDEKTEVLPCKFEESKDTSIWTPSPSMRARATRQLCKLPEGTRLADSITILARR